jgi:hypothetical protein
MECCICLSPVDKSEWNCSKCKVHCHDACFSKWCSLGTGCPQCRDSGNLDELIEMAFSHFGTTNELTCKTTAEKINLFRLMWTLVLVQPSTIEDLD